MKAIHPYLWLLIFFLAFQELVGPVPEGFNDYFANRFPRLLIEVYNVICKHCKDEECFQRYFKNDDFLCMA
jgi:serine/threonine-protein kinase/endoribonuclease IRE1